VPPRRSQSQSLKGPGAEKAPDSRGRGVANSRVLQGGEGAHSGVLARLGDLVTGARLRRMAKETNLDRTRGVTRLPNGLMVGYTVQIIRDGRYVAAVGPWSTGGCVGISIRAESEVELHRRCRMAIRGLVGRVRDGRRLPWEMERAGEEAHIA
jgi:hypothetical protein